MISGESACLPACLPVCLSVCPPHRTYRRSDQPAHGTCYRQCWADTLTELRVKINGEEHLLNQGRRKHDVHYITHMVLHYI